MPSAQRVTVLTCCLVLMGWTHWASAADWIRPDWSASAAPRFREVAMFGVTVDVSPLLYRVEVNVPAGCDRATAMLRTTDWAYVWVDGKQVAASVSGDTTDAEVARVARNRLQWLDLSEQLSPGRHVLVVSASADGFVLDGGLYSGVDRMADLSSHEAWSVTKFAPATVVEDHPIMTLAYDGRAEPKRCSAAADVIAVDAWHTREDPLAAAHFSETIKRLRKHLADLRWRLEILTSKGIYIVDHQALGWAGPGRVRADIIDQAAKMLDQIAPLQRQLTELAARAVRTAVDLKGSLRALRKVSLETRQMIVWLGQATEALDQDDWETTRTLINQATDGAPTIEAVEAKLWARLYGQARRLPLSPLNVSRYDRYGWLPLGELADSDLRRWGVRVNPVADGGRATAERQWLFSTDPADGGLIESRWRMSYPADDTWSTVSLPHDWSRSKDASTARFKGVVWYRGRLNIPATWAGLPVSVKLTVAGDEQVWINDRDVSALGTGWRKRTYIIPAEALVYGGTNRLAVRITAKGPQRGMIGDVVATCPALGQISGEQTPPVDVLASPLSPCVVLTPKTDLLRIYHGGKAALALPRSGRMEPAAGYSMVTDRALSANWVLMWLKPATVEDVRRPILLVFETNPIEIRCSRGLTEIKLDRPGRRVVAVRPWARRDLSMAAGQIDLAERIRFWSRAARAIPINYVSLTDIRPQGQWGGPQIEQQVIYGYLETSDQWETPPLKIAPLPAAASLALDCGRTLEVTEADKLEMLQDGGIAGAYRGIVGQTSVSYRYPVGTSRYVGFTYRAPSGNASLDEMQLLASLGANSVRWRHRWDEKLAVPRPAPRPTSGPARRVGRPTPAELARAAGLRYVHSVYEDPAQTSQREGRGYELFVDALGRYFRETAQALADRDADHVGYELLDRPTRHRQGLYEGAVRKITEQIRAVDDEHLIFVQPCAADAGPAGLTVLEPTGDARTVYGFRDDRFSLAKATDRWPSIQADITDISRHWWPAIEFGIRHGVDLHCTGFGNFPARTADTQAQRLLLNDMLRLIGQFEMHSHFDSAEDLYLLQFDGALRPSNAARAYQAYLRGPWVDPVYRPGRSSRE